VSWRTPDTYHTAGIERGTATSNFYETRDNLGDVGDHYYARELAAAGASATEIADVLRVGRSTVYRAIRTGPS